MKISTQPGRGFMDPAERLEIASGLFPQKMLEMLLLHEVVRSRRYPSPVSVLYLAIRYPKDASAPVVESARLVMANLLQSKLRDADLPGHYEGNYLVILPATDGPGARIAAERLLAAFHGSQITRTAEPFEISISMGVSSHPGGEGISISGLLSGASSALWEAQKRGTKNLVVYEKKQTNAD
jgi:diguanylate cyclase (GGDEF)-like protein